jgi:uncharacterized membrane protein
LTDVPIALLPLALVWDILAVWQGGDFWWKAAFWTLIVGLIAALPTAVTGFLDYLMLTRDSRAQRTATNHMLVMLTAVAAFAGAAIAQGGPSAASGSRAAVVVGLAAGGTLLTGIGGWLGGELVFRHGIGVELETSTESDVTNSPQASTAIKNGPFVHLDGE